MKKFISILIIAFCFFSISAQTDQTVAKTIETRSESDKISVEVVKLFQQKKYEDALPLAIKAVELSERENGKKHISVAQAERNLGFIYLQLNKSKEALNIFEKAVDIYDDSQPLTTENEKRVAELLEAIGIYQGINGELNKAEKQLHRALELREKSNGKDSSETANVLQKLSEVYQVLGEYEKAEPLLKRAIEIKNNKFGFNDETEDVYLNLICTLTKLGNTDEVRNLKSRFHPKPDNDNDLILIPVGVVNGKAINLVKPPYPAEARSKRISGTVSVMVTIDETGRVKNACASSGPKELQRSSEIAAYNSTFSPTTLNGKTVKVSGVIIYNFTAR